MTVTKNLLAGAAVAAQAVSVPDATNAFHTFNVVNFCGGLEAGEYVLSEEIICAPDGKYPNEKHQIYYSELVITPDLGGGGAAKPQTTHAQRMLTLIESQLEYMASHVLSMTEAQKTKWEMVQRPQLMTQYKFYLAKRTNEMQIQNARNGRPPGNTQEPIFCIG